MDTNDRHAIEGLFDKLAQAERSASAAPRDGEAEGLIRERVARQPASPYYMAQTIVVQEQALLAAQARIDELEREAAGRPAGGGFLASIFGDGRAQPAQPQARTHGSAMHGGTVHGQPAGMTGWSGAALPGAAPGAPSRGSGFLAGAAQTAMGVAGGVVLGGLIANAFSGTGGEAGQDATAQQASADPWGADGDMAGSFDSEAA